MGVFWDRIKDDRSLMKIGLCLVVVGHINLLLGALVHGVVLQHVSQHMEARSKGYAVSNVIALVAGLVAIAAGISAIVLSKKKYKKVLIWFLLIASLLATILSTASTVGLTIAMARAIVYRGQNLLTSCNFTESNGYIAYYSISNECPFDPTRLFGTTIILWVPLILTCLLEVVFSGRCCVVCVSLLQLYGPCWRKRKKVDKRRVQVQRPEEMTSQSQAEPDELEAGPVEAHELLSLNRAESPTDLVSFSLT